MIASSIMVLISVSGALFFVVSDTNSEAPQVTVTRSSGANQPTASTPIYAGVWIANLANAEVRDVPPERAYEIREVLQRTRGTLTLHPSGRYEQVITVEGEADDRTEGTYTVSQDGAELYTLTTTPDGAGTTNTYPLTFIDPNHFVLTNAQNGMTLAIPYSRQLTRK